MWKITIIIILMGNSYGFGTLGHKTIGYIATKNINKSTQDKIHKILNGQNIEDIASWADQIKSDPKWNKARSWHYANIQDDKNIKSFLKSSKNNLIWAIDNQIVNLKDKNSKDKKEALMFLVHFIGDIHMPLHIGKKIDRGGNNIKLEWFGKTLSLHEIWDSEILTLQSMSYSEYGEYLIRKYKSSSLPFNFDMSLLVKESIQLWPLVYDYPKSKNDRKKYWEYNYQYKVLDKLEARLYIGGIRLAKLLEQILP